MKGLLCLALLCLASVAFAERMSGTISDATGFAFLGKFCFDYNPAATGSVETAPGVFDLTLSGGSPATGLELLLFDDEDYSWPLVYDNPDSSCKDKRSHAKNLKDGAIDAHFQVKWASGAWSLAAEPITQKIRPRFWFIAVAACATGTAQELKDLQYDLHVQNHLASSWDMELGVNVQGLNSLYLTFFFVFTIFIGVHAWSVRKLSQKLNFIHPLVKLFLTIVALEYLSILLNMIHMSSFSGNGKGLPALERVGEICEVVARIFFMLLLMLVAKGWTISGEALSNKKVIIGTITAFTVSYICILIWKFAAENPAETHVATPLVVFQVLLMVVWLAFAVFYVFTIYGSYKKEDNPVKKTLYARLAFLYTPWFLALPFIVFLSFALDPWVRDKTIKTLQLTFTFIAYVVLSFLTWHSRAEEYFDITTPEVSKGAIDNYEQL